MGPSDGTVCPFMMIVLRTCSISGKAEDARHGIGKVGWTLAYSGIMRGTRLDCANGLQGASHDGEAEQADGDIAGRVAMTLGLLSA